MTRLRRSHNGLEVKSSGWGAYHWREYRISEFLPDASSSGNVLLLGCGDGSERPYLRQRGFDPVGLDIRRAAGPDVLGDAHRLPFRDGTFDGVLSMQVLEHLHSPWIAVEEVGRVLKPGGWFVGSVAFMKPYHQSFFHMTHWGVRRLLSAAGLEADKFAGAQSITYSLYGGMMPIGNRSFWRAVFGAFDRMVAKLRVKAWSVTRRADPDEPTHRYHKDFPLSFRNFDRLRSAPSVVFRARKALP